jgi:lipopolysaccharide export system protein LptC
VKKGRIVSEKPVQMKMPQGTLDANRLEVTETGGVIRFDGGVVMMLTPEALNRGMQSQAATQANAQ